MSGFSTRQGVLPAAMAGALASKPGPDADLIALCDELRRLADARIAGFANDLEPSRHDQPEAWAAWHERDSGRTEAYHDAVNRLVHIKPQTLAGIVAKGKATRLAIHEHEEDPDGRLYMDNHFELALSLAEDCVRLGGAA